MNIKYPIRVGLMDDDFCALKWNAELLTRDLRTKVCFEAETPAELLNELRSCEVLDVILVDAEYYSHEIPLPDLLQAIHCSHLQPAVICLSQYGEYRTIQTAINFGARGFLLKDEVRMGVASALVLAMQVHFLITPGVIPLLNTQNKLSVNHPVKINSWYPHPGLTPKLYQVFILRVLYGMSAPLAAQEVNLAPGTIEKYMQYAYQKLSTQWGDEQYLLGLDLEAFSPEVEAFHLFSLPPKADR